MGLEIVDRYFWLIAIAANCINAVIVKQRAARHVAERPDLAPGYATIVRGYLVWFSVPWAVMGAGILVGGVPSIWHYFRPQDGNIWVLAFVATIIVLWVLCTAWLFLQGGAELIATHPGTMNYNVGSPGAVKLYWLICLVGGIAGLAFMWSGQVALPPLR